MTTVRSFLRNRIAMLMIIIGMIMGFVVPSVIADHSIDLAVQDSNTKEIHILDICGLRDCVLEVSASEELEDPVFVKNGGRLSGALLDPVAGTLAGNAVSVSCARYVLLLMPVLPGMRSYSSLLIRTLHLKDGRK